MQHLLSESHQCIPQSLRCSTRVSPTLKIPTDTQQPTPVGLLRHNEDEVLKTILDVAEIFMTVLLRLSLLVWLTSSQA